MKKYIVQITAKEEAEFLPFDEELQIQEGQIYGKTLYTLLSPGTEIALCYQGKNFPQKSGYASVFKVEKLSPEITEYKEGDILFAMGNHQSFQLFDRKTVVPVPEGLAPEKAVFARLMGISMTTLINTAARAGDSMLVTGLGPVGHLCAKVFNAAGYDVTAVDIDEKRLAFIRDSGIKTANHISESMKNKFVLAVDCSGHEKAVLDVAKILRKGSELVLIGVPWQRRTDIYMHELLHIIFHNYIRLRSGWEWELPRHESDFNHHSIFKNFHTAMNWINDGKIDLNEKLYSIENPADCQEVYQNILHNRTRKLFTLFDWRKINEN